MDNEFHKQKCVRTIPETPLTSTAGRWTLVSMTSPTPTNSSSTAIVDNNDRARFVLMSIKRTRDAIDITSAGGWKGSIVRETEQRVYATYTFGTSV